MSNSDSQPVGGKRGPRAIADEYVRALAALDPSAAVRLGMNPDSDALADFSPDGLSAPADTARDALARLGAVEAAGPLADDGERRCATLLRERLDSELALHEAGEQFRTVRIGNFVFSATAPAGSPLHSLRDILTMMPTDTPDQWQVIGRRMARIPLALQQYRSTLAEGISQGLLSGPRQIVTVLDQIEQWLTGPAPGGWFGEFVSAAPESQRAELSSHAVAVAAAFSEFHDWLRDTYGPAAASTPNIVGAERYRRWARNWTGADLDLDEAYHWAWEQFHDIEAHMRDGAVAVQPGATPLEAMAWLVKDGTAYDGVDTIRKYLQGLIDNAITDLQGTYFDLAKPLQHVEAMIAPAGTLATPYYSPPTLDFSRPGRTYLPTRGRTRFPTWDLVATWYHESVPGHHMQFGQWTYLAQELSTYQVTAGMVGANIEGWALYAEHLMNELGYLDDPGAQMGFLNLQMQRVQRVIMDIGLHTGMAFPADSPYAPGRTIDTENAREFYGRYCGFPADQLDSEIVRYLGMPGQAICYKLGERVWLRGRESARQAAEQRGETFDLKAWHMTVLSQGSLGLDDLAHELGTL
ncbi:MAG: hypothetical protein JWN03_7670 [Nocardia sp.]|uniref:DUF885 domain-containing protein n=1 Tax=Nocardia sp. TaxID=1821 RepID=UPI00261959EB|nr:DUF885 domain-containing protein [Nocardia sp.]MCU1647395.1 hypothetical protein [Nocardia sp.]